MLNIILGPPHNISRIIIVLLPINTCQIWRIIILAALVCVIIIIVHARDSTGVAAGLRWVVHLAVILGDVGWCLAIDHGNTVYIVLLVVVVLVAAHDQLFLRLLQSNWTNGLSTVVRDVDVGHVAPGIWTLDQVAVAGDVSESW